MQFQHTYKGSKPGSTIGNIISKTSFQHTYKGSKPPKIWGFQTKSLFVPAYLQGFETVGRAKIPRPTEVVPAYLQGFETGAKQHRPSNEYEFQHTYKGSKLEAFFSGGRDSARSSIPTRVRNSIYLAFFQRLYLSSSIPTRVRNFYQRDHLLTVCRVPAYLQGFETTRNG